MFDERIYETLESLQIMKLTVGSTLMIPGIQGNGAYHAHFLVIGISKSGTQLDGHAQGLGHSGLTMGRYDEKVNELVL